MIFILFMFIVSPNFALYSVILSIISYSFVELLVETRVLPAYFKLFTVIRSFSSRYHFPLMLLKSFIHIQIYWVKEMWEYIALPNSIFNCYFFWYCWIQFYFYMLFPAEFTNSVLMLNTTECLELLYSFHFANIIPKIQFIPYESSLFSFIVSVNRLLICALYSKSYIND